MIDLVINENMLTITAIYKVARKITPRLTTYKAVIFRYGKWSHGWAALDGICSNDSEL